MTVEYSTITRNEGQKIITIPLLPDIQIKQPQIIPPKVEPIVVPSEEPSPSSE